MRLESTWPPAVPPKTPSAADIKLEYFDQFGNKLNSKKRTRSCRENSTERPGKGRLEKNETSQGRNNQMESAGSSNQSAIVTNLRRQQEETGRGVHDFIEHKAARVKVAVAPVITSWSYKTENIWVTI